MLYLLFIGLPALGTAGGVALLARTFSESAQPPSLKIVGAVVPLLAAGLLIFATAAGGDYASAIVAVQQVVVASATALVGAVVLILRPPSARRIAALVLATAYPLLLFGLAVAGNALFSSARAA
jgi:hypothetical protein